MDKDTGFNGDLKFLSLADVFQILGGNSSTGILTLSSQYSPHKGMIYFLKGNPVNSNYGPLSGSKAVYALFGWSEGNFEFHEQKIEIGRTIKQNRMEIVLDALRMLDDGEIEKVGPPSIDESAMGKNIAANIKKGIPLMKGPLIDYMYVVKEDYYKDGTHIIKEGNHGKWMWVVFEGGVKVSRETSNGTLDIARLGEGCFIGTFRALLFGEYQRTASVTAEGDVRLCLLDTEYLHREYASRSLVFRNLLLSLDNRLKYVTDRTVELYTKEKSDKWSLKNMKMFMKKGSTKNKLYTIKEGYAVIVGTDQKGDIPLIRLNKDDVFGSLPFLDYGHEPRSASIMASKDLEVEEHDVKPLQEEYDRLSSTFRNMIYYVGTSITLTTNLVHLFHKRS